MVYELGSRLPIGWFERSWRSVVISPHFDDAVLSLGGLLQRVDQPAAVVTVHGGRPMAGRPPSQWDADCGFVSAAEAYRVRSAEDARACALLGADQMLLPNADGPYRDPVRLSGLSEFIDALGLDVAVYLPLATNQPDHAKVRDQALDSYRDRRRRRPLVYADLPYTAVVPGWTTGSASETLAGDDNCGRAYQMLNAEYGLTVVADLRLTDAEWSRKRDAVLCYASQLSLVGAMDEVRGIGAMLRHHGPLQSELVWELG